MSVEGYNYDNVFIRTMNRLGEVMLLSVVFTISCLPIVTIGAAFTALHYTAMKGLTLKDGYVWKYYTKSFKDNFKQSTIIWLALMVIYFLLGVDVWYWYNQNKLESGMFTGTLLILSVILLFLVVITTMYIFPLQAKFENGIKTQVRNAFFLSIKYFPTTVMLAVLLAAVVFLIYYQPYICIIGGFVVGFGALGYLYDYFMLKCLKPYLEVEVEAEESIDELVDKYRIPEEEDESEKIATEEAITDEPKEELEENKEAIVSEDETSEKNHVKKSKIILEDVLEKEEQDRLSAERAEQEKMDEVQSTEGQVLPDESAEAVPAAVKELKEKAEKAKVDIEPSKEAENVYRRENSKTKKNNPQRNNGRKQRKK
ncbi:MAG: DUF624 domain-containing protein [Wujia sp.]